MVNKVQSGDFSPVLTSLKQGIQKYLPYSSSMGSKIFTSSALLQLSSASIENLPHVFLGKKMGNNMIWGFFSSRVTYLEAGLLSLASIIHNFVMAQIYTMAVICTLGLSDSLNFSCEKHWSHLGYGVIATGISTVGAVVPLGGIYLYSQWILRFVRSFKSNYQHDVNLFERQLIKEIKSIFKKHRPLIYKFTEARTEKHRFQAEFKPLLQYIEKQLKESKKMEDLVNLLFQIRDRFPKMGLDENR